MTLALFALFASPAHADQPAPTLLIAGQCPDPIVARVNHATPFARIVVARASDAGHTVIEGGPCPGLELDIAGDLRVLGRFTADEAGTGMTHPTLPDADPCSDWLQVVDLTSCTVSAPEPVTMPPFDA